jgi:hypothetical protein
MRIAVLLFCFLMKLIHADGGWQDFWHQDFHCIQAIDSHGHFIKFDDGSIWETEQNSWNCNNRWKIGERIRIDCSDHCGNFRLLCSDLSFVLARPCQFRHHEKHRHFIEEISGAVVRLNTGLSWIVDDGCAEELTCWKVGDEVCLHAEHDCWRERKKTPCCLRNLCTLTGVRVHLQHKQECVRSPFIARIDGNQIILNDGTAWELSNPWDFVHMWSWKCGDRAFIFSDLSTSCRFTLLNFDAHHHNFACIHVVQSLNERHDRFRIQENLKISQQTQLRHHR